MIEKTLEMVTNYKFTKASEETISKIASELGCWISEVPSKLRGYDWKHKSELQIREGHNIVPAVLRNSFATLLSWTTVTPSFKANYCALWTGSVTPSNSDLQLWAEVIRGTFSNRYSIDNVAYFDKFRSSDEVGWTTIGECGVFVDWTAAANSWFLLSRILVNETMTSTETLTVNISITIA